MNWQAGGITRIARHRWPIEVYHEEGKAEGLDQYQLRDFAAVYRHIALVAIVYSFLRPRVRSENTPRRRKKTAQSRKPSPARRLCWGKPTSRKRAGHEHLLRHSSEAMRAWYLFSVWLHLLAENPAAPEAQRLRRTASYIGRLILLASLVILLLAVMLVRGE